MLPELLTRVANGLTSQPLVSCLALAVGAASSSARMRAALVRSPMHVALTGVVIVASLWWAWSLLWASDDAYITFRYAQNLANGHGLVFNPSERVEGYTDFLWAVLIAACIKVGAPPGESAILISLASFVVTLLVVQRLARRFTGSAAFPLAMMLTAANYTMASFATAGLETLFAASCVLLALEAAERDRPFIAGVLGVMATMSHPDHVLFYGALGLAALTTTRSFRFAWRYAAPFVVLFVPYFVWRWHYYSDFWPNTYYAKSGGAAWFSQGGVYLLTGLFGAGLLFALPLALVGLGAARNTLTGRFAAVALPLYLAYVAKIGGDFMLGRLLVPALPIVFLMAEVGLNTLLEQSRLRWVGQGLALFASLGAVPIHLVKSGEIFYGIADERTFTPVTRFSPIRVQAQGFELGKALNADFTSQGLAPRMGVFSLGMSSFYSQLPTFDLRGLTSRSVAHLPLLHRGRPGHEKFATPGMVLEAGVDLSMLELENEPYLSQTRLLIGGVPFYAARYRPELAPTLRRLGLPDATRWFDSNLDRMARDARDDYARYECDLAHLAQYYFSVNDDPSRLNALVAALADSPSRAFEAPFVLQPSRVATLPRIRDDDFSSFDGWATEGDAAAWRTTSPPPTQSAPFGHHGAFVDSFTESGDASQGSLTSKPFAIVGDVLVFSLGGGRSRDVSVSLMIDGRVVRSSTGCDSELLSRRAWDLRPFHGQNAQLVIADRSTSGWGHLLVDDLIEVSVTP